MQSKVDKSTGFRMFKFVDWHSLKFFDWNYSRKLPIIVSHKLEPFSYLKTYDLTK